MHVMFEANRLLQAVEPAERQRFVGRLQQVELRKGQILHHIGSPAEWVYFPSRGLISVLSETVAGESVGCGIIGRDGAVGIFEACGSRRLFLTAIVRIAGEGVRASAATYRELFASSSGLRTAVHKNMEMLMMEARQFVVCNALHGVEARLARFILDALDRSKLEHALPLTQETLAQMLGAQRTTIASCMSKLQRNKVIRGGRGAVYVLDQQGLEQATCSCHETMEYARRAIQASNDASCEGALASA
ncbi:MAG TPA: Crp/Fnr family transcriptional regulator [Rhizomicrobium sp.]|nr:Crp/Fnr family transcriptional regulator [Rhizomicrobium sp.]